MAITSDGNFGTGASGTAGTTLTITPTGTIAVGKVGIIIVSKDNTITTTDRDGSEVTSITDTGSNTWKKCREWTNVESGAGAGVTCSIWRCKLTTQLTTGSTITINFASCTDKAATLQVFSVVTNLVPVVSSQNATDASNGFGSVSVSSGLAGSTEYLFLRGCAKEANSTTNPTASTNFTAINTTRSRNNAAAVLVCGEFRINTSTSETSNPTLAVSGDTAAGFIAFQDVAENTILPQLVQYANFGGTNATSTLRNWPLANAVKSGNAIFVFVQCANGQTPTVTDDKSGSYTVVQNTNDATNSQRAYCAYRLNVTDAPTIIKVDPVAALGFISGSVREYNNIIAVDAFECGAGTTFTGTSGAPGSMVTTADNSLILTMIAEDSVSCYATDQVVASFTVPTNFTECKMDRWLGEAMAERILATSGSSNPSWTSGTSRTFIVFQVAFRAGTQGTPASGGPRIVGVHHCGLDYAGSHGATYVLQVPFTGQGNFVYAGFIGLRNPTGITDSQSNTWTATGSSINNTSGGNSGWVRGFYTFKPTLAAGMTISIATTGSGAAPGDTCFFYEVTGLAGTLSQHASGTGTGTGTSYTLPTFTPTVANGMIFTTVGEDASTSLALAAGGASPGVFMPSTDPAEEVSPWANDENNAWAYYNNPSLSSFDQTFTTDADAGPYAFIQDSFGPPAPSTLLPSIAPLSHLLVR